MLKKLKEIQIKLFNKELLYLQKGKEYTAYSYDLATLINNICKCDDKVLYYYIDYYSLVISSCLYHWQE